MRFGDKLKELRAKKGISQKKLGEILNISGRVIGYYETNERFPKDEKTLKDISDFFNVSTDYLIGRTNTKEAVTVEGNEIPNKLRKIGIDYMEVDRIAKEHGFTPEDIMKILETFGEINKKNNNQ